MHRPAKNLFDHRIGANEHRCGYVEAERLGGLEVDDQLVLGRRLHRQVGRLLTLKNAIDITSRAPVLIDGIGAVGDQATDGDEGTLEVNRG